MGQVNMGATYIKLLKVVFPKEKRAYMHLRHFTKYIKVLGGSILKYFTLQWLRFLWFRYKVWTIERKL